jgi:BirA family transcriptional regulator, biotin operon repressor / biotin---[acetyl-CoA-carboxylase] ligase
MMKQALIQQLKNAVMDSADIEMLHSEVVSSTNDWAWSYFAEQPASFDVPSLFIANQQKQGRGSQGRLWHSPAGTGLYMSLLLPFPTHCQAAIIKTSPFERDYFTVGKGFTKAAGVATVLALISLFPWLKGHLGIRGINDIFLTHRKLGGILVESRLRSTGRLSAVVTGLGLNILHNETLIIKDERNVAISLEEYAKERGIAVEWKSLSELAFIIGKHILALYAILQLGQEEDVEALWLEFSTLEF